MAVKIHVANEATSQTVIRKCVDHDYRAVAELMGSIVAEASGAGVSKEVQETINAVEKATAGMSSDEGASSDKIAKHLKLDQSAAWRRLRVASNQGFIVNLETRPRQPERGVSHSKKLRWRSCYPHRRS